jgi:alpha-tubulin suppressor-like RCC1 family protein
MTTFSFGHRTTVAANTSTYLPGTGGTNQAAEITLVLPQDGTLKNLYWDCQSNGLTGIGNKFTIKVGALHATPTSAAPALTDALVVSIDGKTNASLAFNYPVVAGQRVGVLVQSVAGGTSISRLRVSFELEPTASGGSADDSILVSSLMNQGQFGVNTYYAQAFVMRDGNVKIGGSGADGSLGLGDIGIVTTNSTRTIRPFTLAFDDIAMELVKSVHFTYNSVHILTQNGSVWGWGLNEVGQVGDGTIIARHTPQKIYMRDQNGVLLNPQPKIIKIVSTQNGSADSNLSWYALSDTGKVWSWGHNAYGQLALGDTENRLVPTLTNLPISSPAIDIEAAGGYYGSVFAITANGEAWAAGNSDRGQTGLGILRQEYWIKVPLPNGIACLKVSATGSDAYGHTLWLLSDGRVFAAGSSGWGQAGSPTDITGVPKEVPGLSNISRIWAIGGQHGCSFASRSSDGAFFAWGRNAYAQLGLGDVNNRTVPIQHPLTNIVAVVAGSNTGTIHTVLLDANGYAYAAGYNGYGQCGVGYISTNVPTHERIRLPIGVQGQLVQVGVMGYREFTGTQLLDTRGRVWVCGYNEGNMLCLGDPDIKHLTIPQRVNM